MKQNCVRKMWGAAKKIVFILPLLFLFCQVQAQDRRKPDPVVENPAAARPHNLKVIDEHSDGKGYTVRTLQYDQGLMRVTETVFVPEKLKIGGRTLVIRLDTLKKEYVTVIVDKTNYCVQVLYRNRMIRVYKAVFGPHPLQDKRMEGDRCTPEGWFKIVNKNPASQYDKFMGLSYPDDSAYSRFNRMKAKGMIPQSARIGGSVGIHGIWPRGDDMIEMGVGWTDGCVALKNKDIEELFAIVGVGTRVHIVK